MKVANKNLANQIADHVQPKHMKHYGNEQTSIVRQSSVKSAVELMSSNISCEGFKDKEQTIKDTLEIAQRIEEWVTRS